MNLRETSPESISELRARVRGQFPALRGGEVYLENAGGSQVPAVVANAQRDFMLESYVQIGAGYPASKRATDVFDRAHAFANTLVNGTADGRTILGGSSSQLLRMLADCYAEVIRPGDEVVVANTGHEANVGPWVRLERAGARIVWWRVEPESWRCSLAQLEGLLSDRTRIVALPHVSNLLGAVEDVEAIARLAHEAGARVVADGVAYAPHLPVDVGAWGVDWYAIACYKVYGPHMGLLYGKSEAAAELRGPNHFFVPSSNFPSSFELGCPNFEGCAALLALGEYLRTIGGRESLDPHSRETVEAGFRTIARLESPLTARLLDFLRGKPAVRIIGPVRAEGRVSTVSFLHASKNPAEIVAEADRAGIGIRHGHVYAYRLCEALGIPTDMGVVRVSPVHYNSPEELDRLFEVLDGVL